MASWGHVLIPKPIAAVRDMGVYPDWQVLSHDPTPRREALGLGNVGDTRVLLLEEAGVLGLQKQHGPWWG